MVSKAKALRAEQTTGRKKSAINQKKQELAEQLSNLRLPEVIVPTFSIDAKTLSSRIVLQITDGSIAYNTEHRILSEINISLAGRESIALIGNNGSGKTSLAKAILGDPKIIRTGTWFAPKRTEIGYLDQHYRNLDPNKTVLEFLASIVPDWDQAKLRRHLNDFLFRSNEEVNNLISNISGGEKARLTLAEIAAKTPSLLILDEITNNLDLETKAHVINVLKAYPGSRVLISHDQDFLDEFDAGQFVCKN